jgi:hypothetical protein
MSSVTADPLVQTALLATGGSPSTLLGAVLDAQRTAANLLAGDRIGDSARLLVEFAADCGYPVFAPTSPMAARLVGAALLVGRGAVRATDEGTVPLGEHVLLVEAVAVGTAGLLGAREVMLRLGAARVDMVALHLPAHASDGVHVLLPRGARLRLAATE